MRGSGARRRCGTGSRVAEAVADTTDGEDQLRLARIALELLAQVADVDVDRARLAVVRASPEPLEQHLPRVHPARVRGEYPQELELDVRELDGAALDLDDAAREVDRQPAARDDL